MVDVIVKVVRVVFESVEVVAFALAQANLSRPLTSGRRKRRRHEATFAMILNHSLII